MEDWRKLILHLATKFSYSVNADETMTVEELFAVKCINGKENSGSDEQSDEESQIPAFDEAVSGFEFVIFIFICITN